MHPTFKKMNYKGQAPVLVLRAPDSFAEAISALREVAEVHTALETGIVYPYVLAFNTDQSTLAAHAEAIEDQLGEDAIYYMAYPKKSSKKYRSDITRDQGWEPMGARSYEPVRQVAIDADWSALRFRKVEKIGKLTRRKSMLLSEKGKQKRENESD